MKIENRGKPPYQVSNGLGREVRMHGNEQFSNAATFEMAFRILANLTLGGSEPGHEYIVDSSSRKVMSAESEEDMRLISEAFAFGVDLVKFV